MERQPDHIVLQCYGNEGIFHECTYALLSLSRLYTAAELANVQIWLYTDNPAWFRAWKGCPLPLHCREIDKGTIQKWKGKIDFVHRVKIEVLKDLTKDKQGNILYLDCDIVFTHRIDQLLQHINNGQLYMHIMEGVVSDNGNPVLTKLHHHLRKNATHKVHGKPIHTLGMWNAGVLGFNTRYNYILDEVLAFTDSEYPRFPKHIVEQFAFSVYFQQAAPVKAAAPYIIHYWNLKEARQVLASFFARFKDSDWQDLVRYSTLIQMPALMQEKGNFLHNRSIAGKLSKKQWQPAIPNWDELVKQL